MNLHPTHPRYDVSLPSWPLYPAPVNCVICRGRIHQFSLRRDNRCAGCVADPVRAFARVGIVRLERHLRSDAERKAA